ncbi:MAG: hypothetical protein IT576_12145, partial [Verrucomicrobiales bacterium]|nr:hypothetical protein [Verrucomicrobiales bacterium]
MSIPPTASCQPTFVIGISGHMDLPESDLPEIRVRLHRIFTWLREAPDLADSSDANLPGWWPQIERPPISGSGPVELRPLPGLGLTDCHIVLLTSLAPGSDTLAAEVARGLGIEVRAPLPFPPALYRESSTFTANHVPVGAVEVFDTWTSGSAEQPIHHFPVLICSDLPLSPEERNHRFATDLDVRERRHLRYRAAGEYIAAHSHLILILHQPDITFESDRFADTEAGAGAILRVRRRGPTPGILPAGSHFPWIDSGEVFHVPVRSQKRTDMTDDEASSTKWQEIPARFLPPDHLLVESTGDDLPPELAITASEALLHNARQLRTYAQKAASESCPMPAAALESMIGAGNLVEKGLSASGVEFLNRLAPFAQVRSIASSIARSCEAKRAGLVRQMAAFAFFAALSFHCFAHWHVAHDVEPAAHSPVHAPVHESPPAPSAKSPPQAAKAYGHERDRLGIVFLLITLSLVACATGVFIRYSRTQAEWLRFDARSIAEGLRVQFFWCAAGLDASVAARYMHRQKGELDWIRNTISALSFP